MNTIGYRGRIGRLLTAASLAAFVVAMPITVELGDSGTISVKASQAFADRGSGGGGDSGNSGSDDGGDNSGPGGGGGDDGGDNSGPGSGGDDNDNSGPGSGGDDNDGDNSGPGSGGDDNDGDNSGPGSGDDNDGGDNSGRRGGDDRDDNDDDDNDDDNNGREHIDPATGAKIEVEGDKIEIVFPDGWKEELENGIYELKDPSGRTVIERPATAEDVARMQAIAM